MQGTILFISSLLLCASLSEAFSIKKGAKHHLARKESHQTKIKATATKSR